MFEQDFDGLGIKLGNKVRVKTSGHVGIAGILYVNLSFARQVYVESEGTDKEPPAYETVDFFLLEKVDDGLADIARKPTYAPEVDFVLGDKVKDVLTGIKGFATQRVYSMNGCVSYIIDSKAKGDRDSAIIRTSLDQARLRKCKSSKVTKFFERRDTTGAPSIKGKVTPFVG